MPTLENSEGSLLESETKAASSADMSENEALAASAPNSNDTKEPTRTPKEPEISAQEALAIAWTGIEALARAGKVVIYSSGRWRRVVVVFEGVGIDPETGLKALAPEEQ